MLAKLNPFVIVQAHFASLRRHDTGEASKEEIALHLLLPALLSFAHYALTSSISEGVVGIIISAASIVAGLMLNLLVLIYTLVYNAKHAARPISNADEFKQLASETLATISYSILLCLALVVCSFLVLSGLSAINLFGRLAVVYLGTSTIFCLLIVLKRCYSIVHFELKN